MTFFKAVSETASKQFQSHCNFNPTRLDSKGNFSKVQPFQGDGLRSGNPSLSGLIIGVAIRLPILAFDGVLFHQSIERFP